MVNINAGGFAYYVDTHKGFDEAVVSVLKSAEQAGWTVFQVYDMRERLLAKGFEQKPLKIIEICSGKYAHQFLNKNRLVSLCLPCRITVFEEAGKVKIAAFKPSMMARFFPEITYGEIEKAEAEIEGMINASR